MDNTINEKRVVIFRLLQSIKDDAIMDVIEACKKEKGKPLTTEPTPEQESELKPYLANEKGLNAVKHLLNKSRARLALIALKAFTELKSELKKIAFSKASAEKKAENLKKLKDKILADSSESFWEFRGKSAKAKSIKKVTKNMDLESLFSDKAKEKTAPNKAVKKETAKPKKEAVKKTAPKKAVKKTAKKSK